MKRIENYRDLLAERKRLEQNLVLHKTALKHDFRALKNSLKPMSILKDMIGFENGGGGVGMIGPLAGAGLNAGIDLALKNTVLAKAGFVMRTVVPMAVKGVINFFSKNKRKTEVSRDDYTLVD